MTELAIQLVGVETEDSDHLVELDRQSGNSMGGIVLGFAQRSGIFWLEQLITSLTKSFSQKDSGEHLDPTR